MNSKERINARVKNLPRTAKLFLRSGKLVKEVDLPPTMSNLPDVIFYGALAFHSLLVSRGHYTECSCWRATEENAEKVEKSA